jgi:hypothetical protein
MSEYKIKVHTHSSDAARNLLNGQDLFSLLKGEIEDITTRMQKKQFAPADSIFADLIETDFDLDDDSIKDWLNMGGLPEIKKFRKLKPNEAVVKLSATMERLMNTKNSQIRTLLRHAYNSLQNASGETNEAVKLEKLAHKLDDKSCGAWQLEAVETLDEVLKFKDSISFKVARKHILKGNEFNYRKAMDILKDEFEFLTPSANIRVAYTSLSTQDNEPYLLCPKGVFQSTGSAPVPMEISKCRWNCIDSRVAKDGTVSCAYQDWLKVSFQPQEKVMARLNVHKSPDNEVNSLNLKEGERSKPLTEGEVPFETRFDKNQKGYKRDSLPEESIEKRLETSKLYGHRNEEKVVKKSQSEPTKTIENQLPRKDAKSNDFFENLLRKLNGIESDTDSTREEQLDVDSLYSRKGGMDESFPEQLADAPANVINIYKEINDEAGDGDDMSTSQHLNKTAKKNDGLNSRLDDSRRNPSEIDNQETQLQERHTIKKDSDIDTFIEALLAETDEDDWGHQYSDEEVDDFVNKLGNAGIDTMLEDKRKSNLDF